MREVWAGNIGEVWKHQNLRVSYIAQVHVRKADALGKRRRWKEGGWMVILICASWVRRGLPVGWKVAGEWK